MNNGTHVLINASDVDAQRFESFVRKTDSCWHWAGTRNSAGYGTMGVRGSMRLAHRIAFVLAGGQLIQGLTIDHLCRNRLCVNPAHLEQVSNGENSLRGHTNQARNAAKTHCLRGHEFTPENTHIEPHRGRTTRRCLTCRRERESKRRVLRKTDHAGTVLVSIPFRLDSQTYELLEQLRADGWSVAGIVATGIREVLGKPFR